MKINKKDERGFSIVDIGIAITVMAIFAAIMSSMIYSVYLSGTEAKRTAIAINYAVDVFEQIGQEPYSAIESKYIFDTLNAITNLELTDIKDESTTNEDIATAKIGTYNLRLEMTEPYEDGTIKKFKLTITYPVSSKNTESVEFERIRIRSNNKEEVIIWKEKMV